MTITKKYNFFFFFFYRSNKELCGIDSASNSYVSSPVQVSAPVFDNVGNISNTFLVLMLRLASGCMTSFGHYASLVIGLDRSVYGMSCQEVFLMINTT